MTKELQQFHDFVTYILQDAKMLSRAERLKALLALMFIIERDMGISKRENVLLESINGYFQVIWNQNGLLLLYQQIVSLSLLLLKHTKDVM